MKKAEIIGYSEKGNVVRLYLGKNGTQYGEDWYKTGCEIAQPYEEFIKGYYDLIIPFDMHVMIADYYKYSKRDLVDRKVPFMVYSKKYHDSFEEAVCDETSIKLYFGDNI